MLNYQLTRAAEKDLESILEFGIAGFGMDMALSYYDQLVEKFDEISTTPKQFPSRDELREGYRLCSYRSHDIYFLESPEAVTIVRILNRQNIESAIQDVLE